MVQSLTEALVAVNDALVAVNRPEQRAQVAAQATVQALGCGCVVVWHIQPQENPGWRGSLQQVPGIEHVIRVLPGTFVRWRGIGMGAGSDSSLNDVVLQPMGMSGDVPDIWQGPVSLPALTGHQVLSLAQLADMPGRVLKVLDAESKDFQGVFAGLYRADHPMGALTCVWPDSDEGSTPDLRELSLVCLSNFLGPVLGQPGTLAAETDLYLAGIGVLLTALDLGPPQSKASAEAMTRVALEMASQADLRPSEVQSLQWAALFHEVGRAPMSRWTSFQPPGAESEPDPSAPDDVPALMLIPGLEPAAQLLSEAQPAVVDGQGDLDSAPGQVAQGLAQAFRSVSEAQLSSPEPSAMADTEIEAQQAEELWDTTAQFDNMTPAQETGDPTQQVL